MPIVPSTRLTAALHRATPWKNGLGISYTIADFPHGAGFDLVEWQVSHTEIGADCPFSDLVGLDRQFMVIEGAGVELTCADAAGNTTVHRIDPLQAPFSFHGDWRTTCRLLDGPVKVFNVMTRRGKYNAIVEIVSALEAATEALAHKRIALALPSLDAWILDGPPPAIGHAVLVGIRKQ